MYSLLIAGKPIGDFQDWPGSWNRGLTKPAIQMKKKSPVAPEEIDCAESDWKSG
jgi:hypothetical protein